MYSTQHIAVSIIYITLNSKITFRFSTSRKRDIFTQRIKKRIVLFCANALKGRKTHCVYERILDMLICVSRGGAFVFLVCMFVYFLIYLSLHLHLCDIYTLDSVFLYLFIYLFTNFCAT